MKKLTRSDLKKMIAPRTKDVEIPEWDAIVTIKALTANSFIELQQMVGDGKKVDKRYYFALVAYSVVDDKMKYVFTTEDVENMDAIPLNRLLIEIVDFNNLNPNAVKEAKEEFEKNLLNGSVSS